MPKLAAALTRNLIVGFALLASCHSPPPPVHTPVSPWPARARQDILAAYTAFAENHPGMHDPENPGFPAALAAARDAALRVPVDDRAGYVETLGTFTAGLADGHAQVAPRGHDAVAALAWPGFVVAWRGNALFVHDAGPSSPAPAGTPITACNGLAVTDFVRQRMRTRGFRPNEAGQWWLRATDAFVATEDTRATRAERCTFGGRESRLVWTGAPEDLDARLRRATDGERTPIGLGEARPGIFLVGLPDFHPNTAAVDRYHALFAELRARHAELARARAIVLDLRHNGGGSSAWSEQTAAALWGEDATQARIAAYGAQVRVAWRASRGNVAHVLGLEPTVRAQGNTRFADELRVIGAGMRDALARGTPFYVENAEPPPPAIPTTDLRTPVYVITPGRCGSACLDAVDTFALFPTTKRVGAPTSADSTYLDVRFEELPSGEGEAVIPIKVYVNRPRRSGEIYRPAIEVDDVDWSTKTFLDRIERDLAG